MFLRQNLHQLFYPHKGVSKKKKNRLILAHKGDFDFIILAF